MEVRQNEERSATYHLPTQLTTPPTLVFLVPLTPIPFTIRFFAHRTLITETFMTSLPPFPPNPAELASLSQVGSSWTAFHSSHASAQFFKAKRYLPQSFSLAMSHLNTLTSPAILEVGCGAGAALFPLLSSLPPATSAIAIDIAPTAIELLRSQPKFDPM